MNYSCYLPTTLDTIYVKKQNIQPATTRYMNLHGLSEVASSHTHILELPNFSITLMKFSACKPIKGSNILS